MTSRPGGVGDPLLPDRSSMPRAACPPTHGGWAALALVLFFPLGVPAMAAASRVRSSWAMGEAEAAERASRVAGGIGRAVAGVAVLTALVALAAVAVV